jgi:hypothetical protein
MKRLFYSEVDVNVVDRILRAIAPDRSYPDPDVDQRPFRETHGLGNV